LRILLVMGSLQLAALSQILPNPTQAPGEPLPSRSHTGFGQGQQSVQQPYTNPTLQKDWPMYGGNPTRNAVGMGKRPPKQWAVKIDGDRMLPVHNIRWIAGAGTGFSMAAPVVANGYVWMGTNNENPRDPARKVPAPVLMCFRESDGAFVWQYLAPVRKGLRADASWTGIKCSPLIAQDRLWFTTPGAEVVCLDIGPLLRGQGAPVELWKVDMTDELNVFVHPMVMGWPGPNSVALLDRWIFVNTDNGADWSHTQVPHPLAPSLVCLEKETGQLVWEDNSPGNRVFHIQWSSPLAINLDGTGRVFAGFGDGMLRSFIADTGKLLWELDCNPPEYRKHRYPAPEGPSEILATPVFHDGRVYVTIGQEPEHGEGAGNLVCADARTGSLIWQNPSIQRSISSVVVQEASVYATDFSGFIHGLDANTGRIRWRFDARSHIWSSPLIVDGLLYVGDEDGDMVVIDLARMDELARKGKEPMQLDERSFTNAAQADQGAATGAAPVWINSMQAALQAPAIYANDVLYLNAGGFLCAIAALTEAPGPPPPTHRQELPNAVFVPTPQDVVERMLELAATTRADLVMDLGSGDGRIVITAARKHGSRAVGYELHPTLVQRSRQSIRQLSLGDLVRIEEHDLFAADLSQADVVAVFLPASLLQKLLPQFRELKPGARIVSHDFLIPGIPPDQTARIISREDAAEHSIHLWKAPLPAPGSNQTNYN
jgi:outer membrane protein assembly factor BamB/protein-L-isoaspartate O-methyltransferase